MSEGLECLNELQDFIYKKYLVKEPEDPGYDIEFCENYYDPIFKIERELSDRDKIIDVIKSYPFEAVICIDYINRYKKDKSMLNYDNYSLHIKQRISPDNFNLMVKEFSR